MVWTEEPVDGGRIEIQTFLMLETNTQQRHGNLGIPKLYWQQTEQQLTLKGLHRRNAKICDANVLVDEKLTIVGNLGQDPELRHLEDGTAVTSLSVAVNKKRNGQKSATWFRVSLFRVGAENVCRFLKKGSKVLVEGSNLRVNVYTAKDGKPASSLEFTADRVVFLDSPEESTTIGEDTGDIPF